jgi:hypothetical protein
MTVPGKKRDIIAIGIDGDPFQFQHLRDGPRCYVSFRSLFWLMNKCQAALHAIIHVFVISVKTHTAVNGGWYLSPFLFMIWQKNNKGVPA